MPVTNEFLPFATAGGAYVMSPGAWAAFAARLSGYPPGLLTKEALNTALRQAAFVAASLSQWVSDTANVSVLDDGVVADWEANFRAALQVYVKTQLNGTFIVYAGNPNGHVAGVQGNPGVQFPSVVWDVADNAWWVCVTTGNAAAAVWTQSGGGNGTPIWCGLAGGTANAIVLTPPATFTAIAAGTLVSFQATATNTGATTLAITGVATAKALKKPSGGGPIPLTGGEIANGNIITARYDGTIWQLSDTALGTAALQNASAITGIVAGVVGSGAITPGNIAIFSDALGTIADGGPPNVAPGPTYLTIANNNLVLGPGVYAVDSRGGALTLKLPPAPAGGKSVQFIDPFGCWTLSPWTLDRNGHTIMGAADNLIMNVAGEEVRIFYEDVTNHTWTLE